jgi:hypothetical protein
MRALLIFTLFFLSSFVYAQSFEQSLSDYLYFNDKRDSVVVEVVLLLDHIHINHADICDYSDDFEQKIIELNFYTEEIIKIIEIGKDHPDVSRETKLEKEELIKDRRKRNSLLPKMIRELLEECTM